MGLLSRRSRPDAYRSPVAIALLLDAVQTVVGRVRVGRGLAVGVQTRGQVAAEIVAVLLYYRRAIRLRMNLSGAEGCCPI
jgi:hypothetical protein